MHEKKESYRHIFKATSLFGGAQVIQILANLVRGKFVALLLGPTGMGISSLYISSTTMISNITGLGLNFSAVRDISKAAETKDKTAISRVIKVFKVWTLWTSLVGLLLTICFASFLSKFAFGNYDYGVAFILLSVTVLINAFAKGNLTILQGMRKLNETAKASVIGAIVGIFTSIPLYYFWGVKGIIPAIILASITQYLTSAYYTKKINKVEIKITNREIINSGKEMIKLGIIMMVSIFLGALVTYLVNSFIRYKGGVADVGLYQAGISITNQFVGLVFVAMGSDFFPRLSALSNDNLKIKEMVNQQAEIIILIAAPLLIALIIAAPLLIRLILSSQFYTITEFVRWMALGMFFKAATYSVGYIAFAKGDKNVFFFFDGLYGNIQTLIFNVIAYNFWGLKGLGISFVLTFFISFVAIQILTRKLYTFSYGFRFYKLFLILFFLGFISFVLTFFFKTGWIIFIGSAIFGISALFSLKEMDKLMDIRSIIQSKLRLAKE
jgi:O-antigen/teichoic acid export membrane protein